MKRRKTPNTISGLTAWGQNYLNHTAHGETQTRSSLGNETERAARLETAVARVIAEGKVRTYDMSGGRGEGGKDSILDVAKAVADYASS